MARFCSVVSLVVAVLIVIQYGNSGEPPPQPFSVAVTEKPLEMLRGNLDYPVGQIIVDGEVWLVFVPGTLAYGETCPVYRYKGPDFQHLEKQPEGMIQPPPVGPDDKRSCHLGCGLWRDDETGWLYALIHNEYDYKDLGKGSGWCRKKTAMAISKDMGLSWTIAGDVLTANLPHAGDWSKYSGSEFEAGPADFSLYVDRRGGYFYVTTWNSFVPKQGPLNGFHMYSEVARCAIGDKMAPGKWFKFCDGRWTEPGLGGRDARVGMDKYGLYGNTIYSTYLKKYLRIGITVGTTDERGMPAYGLRDNSIFFSTCSDLSQQDWTPMAKLTDEPRNKLFGFSLADVETLDPYVCGRKLRAYNYWLEGSRILEVALGPGETKAAFAPQYGSYSYEPHPESGDPMESRKTKITGCAHRDMQYAGDGWKAEENQHAYKGQQMRCDTAGNSVAFSFRGADVYWRAVLSPNGGIADVSIDGGQPTTVDCYATEPERPYQFAFLKTGLDPNVPHTIKIVVRGEKNEKSTGTSIRHVALEHSAESYRAAAGFCSVAGKNHWRYQSLEGTAWNDMTFTGVDKEKMVNRWSDGDECCVGNDYQIAAGQRAAVRKWTAPHDGDVRIEGDVAWDAAAEGGVVAILKNDESLWTAKAAPSGKTECHDRTTPVKQGDSVSFVVKQTLGKVVWDPTITYQVQ